MAEQLEIVIGANVDDAKAGVKDLQGVINDFARQGKLSIGVVEQSLAQLRAQIKVTSNPDDVAKLKQAYTELNKTLQQLKISGGLESQLNGISRSTRLAHSDLDQMSRSLAEVASGNGNVIESLSRVAFSFEQLRGQAGSTKGALAELGDVLKSPTGLLVAGAALVPLLIDMGSKFLDIASGSRQAEEDLKTLTAQLKISQEAIKGFNEDIDQAAVTRRLRIDIETPPGIGRTIKELGADLDAAQLKILNTLPAIKSYREELDRVEASSKKVAEAQKDLHVGSLAFEQNKVTLENNARQIELLKKQIQEANKELEKAQQDVINIPLKIQLTNLDEARAEGKKQLQEFNRNLIERAKADAPFFEVPVNLKFVVGDTSERELEKAKDILSGIEEHTIRLKIVVPDAIELPKLKPEVDQPFFKQQLNDLIKGFDIPIRAALDEPSLAQTEDAIKKIFSGFSDTNIFTQFGHSAGE
jgi:chromosome segregation ATPase